MDSLPQHLGDLKDKYMEQELWQSFEEGFLQILKDADVTFMTLFVLWSYIVNRMAEHSIKYKWMNWFTKISKGVRVFILGVIMAFIYGYLAGKGNKEGVESLFYSITITMIAYNLFIGKLVSFLENKTKK